MTTLNCPLHCIPIVSIVARRNSKENECARRVIRSRITVTFIRVTDSARKPRVSIVTTGSNPARCRTVTTRRVTIVPIAFKDIIVTRVRHRTIQGAVRPPVVRDVTTTSVTLVLIMASLKPSRVTNAIKHITGIVTEGPINVQSVPRHSATNVKMKMTILLVTVVLNPTVKIVMKIVRFLVQLVVK